MTQEAIWPSNVSSSASSITLCLRMIRRWRRMSAPLSEFIMLKLPNVKFESPFARYGWHAVNFMLYNSPMRRERPM